MVTTAILCLGLNHRTAPIELRERLSGSLAPLQHALFEQTAVSELVALTTCNRIELYLAFSGEEPLPETMLLSLLAQHGALYSETLKDYVYFYEGDMAANHLLRVAAGLDSLLLGEPQILGQVSAAYRTAVQSRTIGPVLNALFKTAVRTGKRARAETTIGNNPASISSIAVTLAQQRIGQAAHGRYLVLGAGEMSRMAVKALRHRGLKNIAVANRTVARAAAMVAEWGGQAYSLDELAQAIAQADVLITAAHTTKPLIDIRHLQGRVRPLIIIDIAMPRNVDTAVAQLPGISLFDIDDLQATLDESLAVRQAEIPQVEAIIAQEAAMLHTQLLELTIKPVIVEMRRKAEAIRQNEWERTLKHLDELDPQTLAYLQHFSHSLVNKLLHEPTLRLKEKASANQAVEYAATVRELFGLAERVE
jgi:glutamyl-tRNA reductase